MKKADLLHFYKFGKPAALVKTYKKDQISFSQKSVAYFAENETRIKEKKY